MIELINLTKNYGSKTAVKNLNLKIKQGTVMGYLGPNGAGKTTTIRCLMGFIKPSAGQARIKGLDCWQEAAKIHPLVGYLPGEIHFIENMTAGQYLNFIAKLYKVRNTRVINDMADRLQLPLGVSIHKMSKGMKQKTALIQAFLHDPEILILDEPTSGLDPLMQRKFIDLILKEKERGKTILISSHLFREVERTCDQVTIIKNGEIAAVEDISRLKNIKQNKAVISVKNVTGIEKLSRKDLTFNKLAPGRYEITYQGDINKLIRALAELEIEDLELQTAELEEIFMHYYRS